MEKTAVRINAPMVVAGLTIIPLTNVSLFSGPLENVATVCGVKTPVAFVIVSPMGITAYRVSGEEVSIGELIEEIPGIKQVLARF